MNAKMAELRECFEAAGFGDVKTVLSSGNVVFAARATAEPALEKKIEAAMKKHLDRSFMTIVRSVDELSEILDRDPYRRFDVAPAAKRVVTFLREPPQKKLKLPIESDGATILAMDDRTVFSAYVPGPKAGAFMGVIERALGKDVTTRTWDTVKKLTK